jgi:subtilase family serine protease
MLSPRSTILYGVAAVSALAAAGPASTAGTGAARLRPDLIEARLSNPPARVAPGGTFALTDVVANRGRATARRSTTVYTLTGGELRVAVASRAIPRLRPRRSSRGTAKVTIPAATQNGTYTIVACADATHAVAESNERNNCRTSTPFVVRRPPLP